MLNDNASSLLGVCSHVWGVRGLSRFMEAVREEEMKLRGGGFVKQVSFKLRKELKSEELVSQNPNFVYY